jgi:hypothetical protein
MTPDCAGKYTAEGCSEVGELRPRVSLMARTDAAIARSGILVPKKAIFSQSSAG